MTLKNVLLTTHHLVNFAGSELSAFDLACEFRRNGLDVTVATFFYDLPMKALFEREGIPVVNVLHEDLVRMDYDLVWAQHAPVLYACLFAKQIRARQILASSLSPYEPLEAPPVFHSALGLCLANSCETRDSLVELGVDASRLHVFLNSVTDDFFDAWQAAAPMGLKKLAIVSNHVPSEVLEASEHLRRAGVEVDHIGAEGRATYVDVNLLKPYDAILTIGRTVQYGLAMGRPVYCYDRFGGPGWIRPENLKRAEYYNFSGRCCHRKLSAEALADELLGEFAIAREGSDLLHQTARMRYSLVKNVGEVLAKLSSSLPVDLESLKRYRALEKHNQVYLRELTTNTEINYHLKHANMHKAEIIAHLEAVVAQKEEESRQQRQELLRVEALANTLQGQLEAITSSASWRWSRRLRRLWHLVRLSRQAP